MECGVNNRRDHLELQGSVIEGICKVDLSVTKLICGSIEESIYLNQFIPQLKKVTTGDLP